MKETSLWRFWLWALLVSIYGCGDPGSNVDLLSDTSSDTSDEVGGDSSEDDLVVATIAHDTAGEDTEVSTSGTPHIEITFSKKALWDSAIAMDTLSRRILGLRWDVKRKGLFSDVYELWPESGNLVSDARLFRLVEMFKEDPWVVSVKPVYADPSFTVPKAEEGQLPIDDPTWYLGPLGINAYQAWAMIEAKGKKPGEGVLVGLPDTGYLDHPELFFPDGSTRLRLDLQKNFSESSKPNDAHDFCNTLCGITINKTIKLAYVGHGSTTASLIISPPEKQPGTVGHLHTEGAAPYAEVIPIRVAPSVLMTGSSMGKLAKGIRYATQKGAQVISISMGGVLGDAALRQAIKDATDSGVIVLAAAGNAPYRNTNPLLMGVSKPASYEETIAVCGSNAYGEPWRDTARGSEVDICAPAEDVRRARAGWVNMTEYVNDTDRSEGTSMSTALAASVAALWLGYHGYDALLAHYGNRPSKVPEAFRQILQTSGCRKPSGWDTARFGAGIIDAALVLKAPLPKL
ncbi:MAG: S8/S53 family peptidase [Myxococcota bacterium]|jgi:thermitase|nr:S8/S53 family peptidase [Myxococcota bacterium]